MLAYDHRGSGITIAPPNSITFDRLVDDVFAVLDHLEIDTCVLAAMSMGAMVALGAAIQQPRRISELVLVNGLYHRTPVSSGDTFLSALQHNYPAALSQFITACLPEPDVDPIRRWGQHILNRATQEAAVALYRLPDTVDLRADLPHIQQPTLIIHGDADALVPLSAAQHLAQTMPNAYLAVIEGAGHVPILTRPQAVVQHMTEFLAPRYPQIGYSADT